ncbi:MAG: endonuclease [Bacteroidales bacterium]|nr:endonuclease [Bacteroidales bacterium]
MLFSNIFKYLLFFTLCLSFNRSYSQHDFCVLFYNVENLFDIYDDTTKSDNEFLPTSKKYWTQTRYNDKLSKLVKVFASQSQMPDIIGLAEVENTKCLKDLIFNTPLSKFKYAYVHYESPDIRGIDVALLYKKDNLQVISSKAVAIEFPYNSLSKTRDILYVKVYSNKLKDTLHLMVNHWPSRRGGKKKSEDKRIYVAAVVRSMADSIMCLKSDSKILIMGDLNDNPSDLSIKKTLLTGEEVCDTCIVRMQTNNFDGTYKFQGRWGIIDHFIANGNLLTTYNCKASILNESFLLKPDDKNFGVIPFKTYIGMKYEGGFSDHLPIYFILDRK